MRIPDDLFPSQRHGYFTLMGVIEHEKKLEPIYWSERVARQVPPVLIGDICQMSLEELPSSFDWQRYDMFGTTYGEFTFRADSPFTQADAALLRGLSVMLERDGVGFCYCVGYEDEFEFLKGSKGRRI